LSIACCARGLGSSVLRAPRPPLPTVAPTRVPTVHSLPPPLRAARLTTDSAKSSTPTVLFLCCKLRTVAFSENTRPLHSARSHAHVPNDVLGVSQRREQPRPRRVRLVLCRRERMQRLAAARGVQRSSAPRPPLWDARAKELLPPERRARLRSVQRAPCAWRGACAAQRFEMSPTKQESALIRRVSSFKSTSAERNVMKTQDNLDIKPQHFAET